MPVSSKPSGLSFSLSIVTHIWLFHNLGKPASDAEQGVFSGKMKIWAYGRVLVEEAQGGAWSARVRPQLLWFKTAPEASLIYFGAFPRTRLNILQTGHATKASCTGKSKWNNPWKQDAKPTPRKAQVFWEFKPSCKQSQVRTPPLWTQLWSPSSGFEGIQLKCR